MEEIGKIMLLLGGLLIVAGGVVFMIGKLPGIGRLPGDIVLQRDGLSCFFPIATSIVLSIVFTILLQLAYWLTHR